MIQLRLLAAPLAITLLSAPAGADSKTTLQLQGNGPYYRLTLPVQAYALANGPLESLHIINGAGKPVPFAWLDDAGDPPAPRTQPVPFFAVPKQQGSRPDAELGLKQRADGSLGLTGKMPAKKQAHDWIIDASHVKGALWQLEVQLQPQAKGLFPLQLDGSDDLRNWQRLDNEAQLLNLQQGATTLTRTTLDLQGGRWRYLRLVADETPLPIAGVRLTSQPALDAHPPLQWSPPVRADHCDATSCVYVMPRHTPLDSLRLQLQEINSLAQIQIDGLLPMQPSTPMRSAPRNPLYVLRHKRAEAATPASKGQSHVHIALGDTTVYRLQQDRGEARSPDLPLSGGIYPALRISTSGPISQLGSPPPLLHIGTLPRTLVLLAQGNPPYQLALGQAKGPGDTTRAMSVTNLIPGYESGKPLQAGTATIALPMPPLDTLQTTGLAPASAVTPADKVQAQRSGTHKPWLWAVLGGGLLLLAAMAWSLLKQGRREPS